MTSKAIKRYLQGFLLAPWIWAFGFYTLINVLFIIFNQLQDGKMVDILLLRQNDHLLVKSSNLVIAVGLFLVLNYTASFFIVKKYPRLETLAFLTSIFTLLLLVVISWSYFKVVLGIA